MADVVTIEASLLRDLMTTHDSAACGCRHYDTTRPKPCVLLMEADAALKVSEGTARTQIDPVPSDVTHVDTSLSDPIIAGGNVTQWPESRGR